VKARIVPVEQGTFADCVDFLRPRERRAIGLAGNLMAGGKPCFLPDAVKEFLALDRGDGIEGLFLMTRTGILLHCIDDEADRDAFAPAARNALTKLGVRCAIGKADDTRWIESLLPLTPFRTVDYKLMVREVDSRGELSTHGELNIHGELSTRGELNTRGQLSSGGCPLPSGTAIFRASPADAEELLSLQEGYEKEEVMPPGDPFNRDACLSALRGNLRSQCVWYAREAGRIVAKAGTNARGIGWDQLGGVYTVPERRGLGLATALADFAAADREREGKRVALFVKLVNAPAIRAYLKAGFKPDVDFRISYF